MNFKKFIIEVGAIALGILIGIALFTDKPAKPATIAWLQVDTAYSAELLPEGAFISNDHILIVKEGIAQKHTVEVGETTENGVEILSGLEGTETIVLEALEKKIKKGDRVRAVVGI